MLTPRIAIVALALGAVGCPAPPGAPRRQSPPDAGAVFIETPPATADTAADAGAEAVRTPDASEPSVREPNTRVGNWGIEIWVPEDAKSDIEPEQLRLSFPRSLSVTLSIAHAAAPASLDEALKAWNWGTNLEPWDQGTTAGGVLYALRSFEVRVGVPGHPGLHRIQTVSRVYSLFPLDAQKHVLCTAYIEHAVESASDPVMQIARDVCTSIRKSK